MQKALTAYFKTNSDTQNPHPIHREAIKPHPYPPGTNLKLVMEKNKKRLQEFCRDRMDS